MKRSSRLALLVSSSLLFCIVPIRESEECISYPDWEEYRMRFFEPGLDGQAGLSPFYYTQHWLYPGTDDPESEDIRRNCQEWQTYLGVEVALADIDSVLYGGTKSDNFLTPLVTNELATAFPQNTFVKKLLEPRHRAALEYLTFVKQLEFVQSAEADPWYEWSGKIQEDHTFFNWEARMKTLCRQSLEGMSAQAADPFLQKRYAYQAVVCHRYYGPDSVALNVFNRHFSLRDTTVLMPWALIHKADCMLRRGDTLEYNYLLSQVFDRCKSRKIRAVNLFVSALTEPTLTHAPTPHDKALVLTMKALQYPGRGMSLLRRIADFDPKCRYLPLLISREINKLEDWTLTQKLTGYGERQTPEDFYDGLYDDDAPKNAAEIFKRKEAAWRRNNLLKDRAYLQELRVWTENLERTNGLPGQRDFLRLAAAHLNFLEGNYNAAQGFLSNISPQSQPRLLLQRDMERILLMPYTRNLRESVTQTELARQLRHIWDQRRYLDQPAVQMSRLHFYLCHAFFRIGDIPSAGLFYNKAWLTCNEGGSRFSGYDRLEFFNAHATISDLDRLIALQANGSRTVFEKYLIEKPIAPASREIETTDEPWWYSEADTIPAALPPLNDLLELQGTIAFRDGDLTRSAAIFNQIPADFWTDERLVDVDIFADAAHFPVKNTPSQRCGKVEVVNQMLALEAESHKASGPRLAEIYYQLGNGWFNCSYFGRSWYMFSYSKSYEDDDSPEIRTAGNFPATPDVHKYGSTYFRFDRALAWYRRALAAHPPNELAAKIEYMIADCDRYVRILHESDYYGYGEKLPQSPLFRQWAARYGRTATFAERMEHCPELKDYLGR